MVSKGFFLIGILLTIVILISSSMVAARNHPKENAKASPGHGGSPGNGHDGGSPVESPRVEYPKTQGIDESHGSGGHRKRHGHGNDGGSRDGGNGNHGSGQFYCLHGCCENHVFGGCGRCCSRNDLSVPYGAETKSEPRN